MKKFTPILILILIVGVVSISGCITVLNSNDTPTNTINNNNSQNQPTTEISVKQSVVNVNKSGNIQIGTEDNSKKIKNNNHKQEDKAQPKISKDEIEKEVVRIMKLGDSYLNFTANATLIYNDDGTPYYIVDVYDDYGWYGYFEINANNGPSGNDKEGYSFDGGAVRGETGDEPTPIKGIMPKLSVNDARQLLDKEVKANYSVNNPSYMVSGFVENNTPYYNITIEETGSNGDTTPKGYAIMDANNGKIINISLEKENNTVNQKNEKVYSVDEAGAYVDIVYKGKQVSVRENYPYYSPQNDKIYYSQEEEAEDLIKHYEDFN